MRSVNRGMIVVGAPLGGLPSAAWGRAEDVARLSTTVQWPSLTDPDVVRRVCTAPGARSWVSMRLPLIVHAPGLVPPGRSEVVVDSLDFDRAKFGFVRRQDMAVRAQYTAGTSGGDRVMHHLMVLGGLTFYVPTKWSC